MTSFKACVQTIHCLLSRLGGADKLKIVKLLFLADKLHLISFGRTITGDSYFAMRYGPVGSMALDILNKSMESLSPSQIKWCDEYLEQISEYGYRAKKVSSEYDLLSKSDQETIKEISDKLGIMTDGQLIELTHKYPEWAQHKQRIVQGITKSEPINTEDLFSSIPNDPLGVPPEIIKDSKEIFLGLACEVNN